MGEVMTTMGSQTTNTHSLRSQRARSETGDDVAEPAAMVVDQGTGDGEWCGYCGDIACRCAALRFSPRSAPAS